VDYGAIADFCLGGLRRLAGDPSREVVDASGERLEQR
jgi:hypothetical protein